jgi:hypothetical protein
VCCVLCADGGVALWQGMQPTAEAEAGALVSQGGAQGQDLQKVLERQIVKGAEA